MAYRKIRKIVLCALAALSVVTIGAACSGGNDNTNNATGGNACEEYIYNTDQPFYSQADAFMTIDGKFEEEQWQDCKWLECNRVDMGTKLKMTTKFTQAGIYVGAIAYHDNIVWEGRHNYPSNSNFYVQIAKGDEKHYGSYPIYNHPMRDVLFYADAKNSLSLRETQYVCATYCDGELNSGETKSLSMELFVSWEDMHYTQDELDMNGMPSQVRMWIKYSHPGKGLYAGFMDQGAYQTYYAFDKNGVVVDYNSKYLGHAIDGEAAFGDWIFDDENKKAYSTTTKTQAVWFKQDDLGNATSTATDYIAEVTVSGVKDQVGQYAGLFSMQSKTDFSFYTVHVPSIANGKVIVRTAEEMDGSGWMSSVRLNKTPVESGYEDDKVKLTVIKKGGDLYYLCNGKYVGTNFVNKISGKNVVGFYANGAAQFSDWSFKDYTNDRAGLDAILSQHVWFASFEQQGIGTLTANRLAIPQDEGTIDITVAPHAGYALTDLLCNGESIFEEYMENARDFTYRYVTDCDVKVKAVFSKLDRSAVQLISFKFKNEKGEIISVNPTVWLTSENSELNAWLQANVSGVVNADILKASEQPYVIGGREIACDGNYVLKVSAQGYHDKAFAFTVNGETSEYFIELVPVNWGAVTLNGETTTTTGSVNLYDKDNDIYGLNTNTTVKQYYLDTKTNEDYVVKTTVSVANKTDLGNVVGIMLSSGKNTYILLKSCSWETNKLCVEVYDKNNDAAEISVNGFNHTLGIAGGALTFSAARVGDKIYVCNEKDELVFYLDSEGVHTQGNFSFGTTSKLKQVNAGLGDFFAKGSENAVGLVQYYNKGGEYWFDVQVEKGESAVLNYFEPVSFTLNSSEEYQADVSGAMQIGEKYAKNTGVYVVASSKVSGKAVKAIKLSYQDGSEKIIAGNFDCETLNTTFNFLIAGDCTAELLLGNDKNVLGNVTLNGTAVYQIGSAIYDATTDCYGVDSSSTTWNYYADSKTDGDFAFTSTITVAQKEGFGHILGTAISAGGTAYIGFMGCSWEANKLVLEVRDGTNWSQQLLISGFPHSIGGVGGTLTITVVKLDNVFYVYNASGTLAFTLDEEHGLQLQSGFTASVAGMELQTAIDKLNEKLKMFYSVGDENALGFISWKNGTGVYHFNVNMEKGTQAALKQYNEYASVVKGNGFELGKDKVWPTNPWEE